MNVYTTQRWWGMRRIKDGKFATSVARLDGPMRVTGRLEKATLSSDKKFWTVLPGFELTRVRTYTRCEVEKP